ncbi:MAG: serine hydrolase [Gemmatimonadota bacterium]
MRPACRLPGFARAIILGLLPGILPIRLVAQDSIPATSRYAATAALLTRLIDHERADKRLPAVSIALVDDQEIVWARGFGYANPGDSTRATAQTIYRVGSVAKLFTDLAVMQLAGRGLLRLDAPVTTWLPSFRPSGEGSPVTLRQLMTHRSGLVREPAVGNYFDSRPVLLDSIVASLNASRLVYPPGSRVKYSNAAIAVVGKVIERVSGKSFAQYVGDSILSPLGMAHSTFAPPANGGAAGFMWTVDGRKFPAPIFQLGMAPAGNLYSNVNDLGYFLSALFAGGQGRAGRILSRQSLSEMWRPQFADSRSAEAFGLGFYLSHIDGHRRAGHGGAIYGFATDLEALPDEKLGVVVITNLDAANTVVSRIADAALKAMLAVRAGEIPPVPTVTARIPPGTVQGMTGFYGNATRNLELREGLGDLELLTPGQSPLSLRLLGDTLVVDDPRSFGTRLIPLGHDRIQVGNDTLARLVPSQPADPPGSWSALIGEYGWDYNTLYIHEDGGKLFALIEWFFPYPLSQVSDTVFTFPSSGLYAGERVVFHRGADGHPREVSIGGVTFPRRSVGPEDGTQLKIRPVRPVPDLIREALTQSPPAEVPGLRVPELVELVRLDSTIHLEIRYATTNNFAGTVFYAQARAFMQRPAAEAVVRAQQWLRPQGYGLLIHDAYRPWYVTKAFWDAVPDSLHWLVANPANGSRHNRGEAVDLTLYDLKTGLPVEMPGTYDESTPRSYSDYPGGTSRQRWFRQLLRRAMEMQEFKVNPEEWWHFDYKDWRLYPVMNQRFENLSP